MTEYECYIPNLGYRIVSYAAEYTGLIIGVVGGVLSNGHLLPIIGGGLAYGAGKILYEVVKHEKPKDPAKRSGLEKRVDRKYQKPKLHKKKRVMRRPQSAEQRKRPSNPPRQGPRSSQ